MWEIVQVYYTCILCIFELKYGVYIYIVSYWIFIVKFNCKLNSQCISQPLILILTSSSSLLDIHNIMMDCLENTHKEQTKEHKNMMLASQQSASYTVMSTASWAGGVTGEPALHVV